MTFTAMRPDAGFGKGREDADGHANGAVPRPAADLPNEHFDDLAWARRVAAVQMTPDRRGGELDLLPHYRSRYRWSDIMRLPLRQRAGSHGTAAVGKVNRGWISE
jgi:hypothetical protein